MDIMLDGPILQREVKNISVGPFSTEYCCSVQRQETNTCFLMLLSSCLIRQLLLLLANNLLL